jgi:hypothetical protein
VPAPAVIPAPKAYINAVAVKGFVVELWTAKSVDAVPTHSSSGPSRLRFVNVRNRYRGSVPSDLRAQCAQEGVRVYYCD